MKRFGINGFGRIGRTAFRVWWQFHRDEMELALINTSGSMELESWAHLLRYDSNYGPFTETITVTVHKKLADLTPESSVLGTIQIGDRSIAVSAQRDPELIPWGEHGVETVIESTGVFTSKEKAAAHLKAGAKKVIISAPPKSDDITTGIIGISSLDPNESIVSNASCTTNCIGPVAAILHQKIGIAKSLMTTVHSYTDDQNLHDNSHKDLRRARAAALNIVPTSTGAAVSVTKVIPELAGLFDGLAIRVPSATGSLSDMVFLAKRKTTVEEVNQILTAASQEEHWKGILAVTNDPIVSSDIKGRRESSIVDLSLTQVIDGDLVKVISWYDNEFGYCNRLVEQVALL